MGKKKGPKVDKDPFEDLGEEFKNRIQGGSVDAIKAEIAKVALAEEENKLNKDADMHLKEVQAIASEAGAQYRDATKDFKLKMKFMRQVLKDRGQV